MAYKRFLSAGDPSTMGPGHEPLGYMCLILKSMPMWSIVAAWEVVKMLLMVVARYQAAYTRPRWGKKN